jgi:hypothetical protein
MCFICGLPDTHRCDCEVNQPFCDQCADDAQCREKIDSQCVFYHFNTTTPSKLTNLGIPNNTSLEVILETIDALIGNSFNVPFTPVNSDSINWIAGGTVGHSPKAEVIISPDLNNQAEVRSNGFFVKPYNENYYVKVNATDAPAYLKDQVVGGSDPDGIISIDINDNGGLLEFIPSINIQCLLDKIRTEFAEEFCELVDRCKCFLTIENLVAVFGPACPPGYVLNEAGTLCVSEETTEPTISGTTIAACPQFRAEYSAYGALVYNGGYNGSGEGASGHVLNGMTIDIGAGNVTQLLTPNVWQSDNVTGDNNGPANRAGIWVCPYSSPNTLGFVVPIDVPSTKTYYIAVAADNDFRIDVNNVTVVDSSLTDTIYWNDGGAKFRYWHIYPVALTAGVQYLSISGIDTGVQGMLAAEVYDNTLVELQAAALQPAFVSSPGTFPLTSNQYSNLNLIFSTRCARSGATFTIGNATCPDSSWSLDTTGGAPLTPPCQGINSNTAQWICRRTITSPFSGYTATLVWDRIPNAVSYTVEQKLTSDPDSAYVAASGSPVANPGSGTTVNLVINGLDSNLYTFRVRANFEECSTEWTVVTAEDAPCVEVTFVAPVLPNGNVNVAYNQTINLGGTGPFVLTGITKPDWMSIQIIGNDVIIGGIPDAEGTNITVAFTVENCAGAGSQAFSDQIDIGPAPCIAVSFTQDAELPPATEDEAYEHIINLSGTAPFSLSGITKPAWMTIAIVGSTVEITGTPTTGDVDEDVPVAFTVENCTSDDQAFVGTIDVLAGGILANAFRFGIDGPGACAATPTTLYWNGPGAALTPGNIMYTDPAVSVPLTGSNFISDSVGTEVFSINSVTGAIIGTTGNSC